MGNEITFQDVYQTITTGGEFKLGQRGSTPDGREWTFVTTSGAIGANLIAIPNTVTTVTSAASTSDNQGRIVYITSAGATWTVGQFQDGIGLINTGTGSGQGFKIKTNNATMLTLYPETALTTNVTVAGSSGMAILTPANVIIAAVTSKIQQAVGCTQTAFALGDYGWLLTEGDGTVLATTTLVVGAGVTTGSATAGEVIPAVTATGPYDAQNLGFCQIAQSGSGLGAMVRFLIRG